MSKFASKSKSGVGVFALVMLMAGGIDSIRNLPTTALFGPSLVVFFALGAVFFLLPTGLISAELTSMFKDQGGIYQWSKMAFGDKVGALAIWLQWINTMVWFPTILSFIAGTATYFLMPSLAQNKLYLVSVILSVFWLMTWVNLKGLSMSAKLAGWCGLIGMVIPMVLIMLLGLLWLFSGQPLQIHFTLSAMVPHIGSGTNWISLTAIITAFLGMELATVHIKQVKNPQNVFPKALVITIIFITVTMLFGSLAIAMVLPANQINLVNGIMQAFQLFLHSYHLAFLLPVLTVMILVGSIGGMINWLISPAKGLMQAAENGYLPKIFATQNKHGVCSAVLIAQAVVVSLICLAFLLMPSVNGSYWLLTDLSTEIYLLMYVLMFVAAMVLKAKYKSIKPSYQVPGKTKGFYLWSVFGIIGCLISLVVGFIPPTNIDVGSPVHYFVVFSLSMLLMIAPVIGLYLYKRWH